MSALDELIQHHESLCLSLEPESQGYILRDCAKARTELAALRQRVARHEAIASASTAATLDALFDPIHDAALAHGVDCSQNGDPDCCPEHLAWLDHCELVTKAYNFAVGLMERIAKLEADVGTLPPNAHPDEARPRAETWLAERANWAGEVAKLREHIGRLENAAKGGVKTWAAWLIEGRNSDDGLPTYATIEHEFVAWTTDPLKALHFVRKEDADSFAYGEDCIWVREHLFGLRGDGEHLGQSEAFRKATQ